MASFKMDVRRTPLQRGGAGIAPISRLPGHSEIKRMTDSYANVTGQVDGVVDLLKYE